MADNEEIDEMFAAASGDDIDLPPTAAEKVVEAAARQAAAVRDTGEGIFADDLNIFSRRAADHHNPVETVAQERVVEMIPGTAKANPPSTAQLLAVWDDKGRVWVAKGIDGNRVEQWRMPTKAEWDHLRANGTVVRGGLGATAPAPAASSGTMKKVLIGGAALAAVGAVAYFYVKRREESMEDDVEELD